jgi:GTPase SAR1 family protein
MKILYTGNGCAGMKTSLNFMFNCSGLEFPLWEITLSGWEGVLSLRKRDSVRMTILAARAYLPPSSYSDSSEVSKVRRDFLKKCDLIVFVIDPQSFIWEQNLFSYESLTSQILSERGRLGDLKWIFQINKIDLPASLMVSKDTIETHFRQPDSEFIYTSAKRGVNIIEMFEKIDNFSVQKSGQ